MKESSIRNIYIYTHTQIVY